MYLSLVPSNAKARSSALLRMVGQKMHSIARGSFVSTSKLRCASQHSLQARSLCPCCLEQVVRDFLNPDTSLQQMGHDFVMMLEGVVQDCGDIEMYW